jgi:hypothetical protein
MVKLFTHRTDNIIAFCRWLRKAGEGGKMGSRVDITWLKVTGMRFRGARKLAPEEQSTAIKERLLGGNFRMVRPADTQTQPWAKQILRGPENIEVQVLPIGATGCPLTILTPFGAIDSKTAVSLLGRPLKDVSHLLRLFGQAAKGGSEMPLDILGRIEKVRIGNHSHKVVTGLTATPLVVEALDPAIGKDGYQVNEQGVVVNVKPEAQRRILDSLNKKYAFGLRFIDSGEAAPIIRKVRPKIEANDIRWFLTTDQVGYQMTVVNSLSSTPAGNEDHDSHGGLVFVR